MSPAAAVLILAAALAHASWNLLSKQASAAGATIFLFAFAACATALYAPVLAVTVAVAHPRLTALNWVFLAGSGILQVGYFLLLQRGYQLGDLSVVYPIGRGTGALLAGLSGIAILGERPGLVTLCGGLLLISGIVVIAVPGGGRSGAHGAGSHSAGDSHGAGSGRGVTSGHGAPAVAAGQQRPAAPLIAAAVAFAVLTGVFIASYTLWDKYAVADLRTPAVLQSYASFPVMVIAFGPAVLRDRGRLAEVWRTYRLQVIGTAVLAPLAYMLILAALAFTALSVVAPAREVSVLLGVLLGGRLLGEGSLARRLAAAGAVVAGILAIALG